MRRELLPIILCPACKEGGLALRQVGEEGEEIREGVLACGLCGREYPVRKGITDLLYDPSRDVEREIEAWSSFRPGEGYSDEDNRRSREFVLGLPLLEGKEGPREDMETWRRHGRAVFGLCESEDWEGRRVLELGAGRCWLSAHLARLGARVTAIDILESEYLGLGTAEVFLEEGTFFDRVLCDMHLLPFTGDSFDAVVATATLHHSHDPVALLEEVRRVLRPGGLLLAANEPLSVPWRETPEEEERGAHEGAFALGTWLRFLREAGWGVAELEIGREAALHLKAFPVEQGSSLSLTRRASAEARYASIIAMALPRRVLRAARCFTAGRPMCPAPDNWRGYLGTRMGAGKADTRVLAGEEGGWGPGWYAREGGDDPFRWSGPRSRLLLRSPGGAARLTLELATFHPSPRAHPVTIEVSVSGKKVGNIRIDRHGWDLYRIDVPAVVRRRPTAVTMRVKSGYFKPCDMGLGGDSRFLGVACRGAWWEAAD